MRKLFIFMLMLVSLLLSAQTYYPKMAYVVDDNTNKVIHRETPKEVTLDKKSDDYFTIKFSMYNINYKEIFYYSDITKTTDKATLLVNEEWIISVDKINGNIILSRFDSFDFYFYVIEPGYEFD